jgi:hypothetical protein
MEQLQHIALVALAIGALGSLAGLAIATYEFRTGRLLRIPLRRRIPATPDDVRMNGLALCLNDLGALLTQVIILSTLVLPDVRFDPFVAVSYFAVGAAGFTAVFLSMFISFQVRGQVHYRKRARADSVPSAGA